MHMDMVKNLIGGTVNSFLAQEAVTPTEMRYILKSILSEVAELEARRWPGHRCQDRHGRPDHIGIAHLSSGSKKSR